MVEVIGALPIKKVEDTPPSIAKEIKNHSPSMELVTDIRRELEEVKTKMDLILSSKMIRSYPGCLSELYLDLIRQEVEENLAERLIGLLVKEVSHPYQDIKLLKRHLNRLIADLIKVDRDIQGDFPKIIALIGPTGVGKTTTLSKLAARFSCDRGMDVALITIDTYRIAAVEQLKTYAEILSIPLEVVFTIEEFKEAIDNHSEADIILVDTAGRSQRNHHALDELKNFVDLTDYKVESILVISATTKYKDMLDIVENFKRVPFERVIFTKIDETTTLGPMLSLLNKTSRRLSYITIGQNVPEDIEVADPNKISRMILNGG